ncbi:MAG: hypothetical protein JWN35_946, partial [Frankiales bacterium]|nr:hypothetical protein [Frankiales bacterium]
MKSQRTLHGKSIRPVVLAATLSAVSLGMIAPAVASASTPGTGTTHATHASVAPSARNAVGITPSTATAVSASAAAPVGVPGSWKLKFSDEFNGTTLDTSKWSTGWLASGITKGA